LQPYVILLCLMRLPACRQAGVVKKTQAKTLLFYALVL